MPSNETLRERSTFLIVFGFIIIGLGFGALFDSVGFSSSPLSSGPPDYTAPVVLFVAGVVLLSMGVLFHRRRIG